MMDMSNNSTYTYVTRPQFEDIYVHKDSCLARFLNHDGGELGGRDESGVRRSIDSTEITHLRWHLIRHPSLSTIAYEQYINILINQQPFKFKDFIVEKSAKEALDKGFVTFSLRSNTKEAVFLMAVLFRYIYEYWDLVENMMFLKNTYKMDNFEAMMVATASIHPVRENTNHRRELHMVYTIAAATTGIVRDVNSVVRHLRKHGVHLNSGRLPAFSLQEVTLLGGEEYVDPIPLNPPEVFVYNQEHVQKALEYYRRLIV